MSRTGSPLCGNGEAGCSSSGWVDRLGTRPTPSTIFARSAISRPYTPTDNVSELTARVNDEGWDTTFAEWLRGSRLSAKDALLVFSVGGGDEAKGVSANIVAALRLAADRDTPIFGIVGRDGGTTAKLATAAVIIPPLFADHITPHTEGLCAVVWHLLVTHPALAKVATRWESLK